MSWVGVAAAVIGAYYSYQQNQDAVDAQQEAAQDYLDMLEDQYEQTREDLRPWREAGGRALTKLEDLMSGDYDITDTPGYQFRFEQGQQAWERSQVGRSLGGRAAKELTRYGQEYGSAEYGKEFNRLATMAGYGPQAADISAANAPNANYGAYQDLYGTGGAGNSQIVQNLLGNLTTAWESYNTRNDKDWDPYGGEGY